jgi:hypothetical protein
VHLDIDKDDLEYIRRRLWKSSLSASLLRQHHMLFSFSRRRHILCPRRHFFTCEISFISDHKEISVKSIFRGAGQNAAPVIIAGVVIGICSFRNPDRAVVGSLAIGLRCRNEQRCCFFTFKGGRP